MLAFRHAHAAPPSRRRAPRIVIVGAGIAGLNAAYTLRKAGLMASVFSAETRLGGRMSSATGLVAPGRTVELGGEFIDSDHEDLLGLVQEFGLKLVDFFTDPLPTVYYFRGHFYSTLQVVEAFTPIAPKIAAEDDPGGPERPPTR